MIEEVLQDHTYQDGRQTCRKEVWEHEGESVRRVADYLEQKLRQLTEAVQEDA